MIEAIIPLMKPSLAGARIVNVSSRLGRLNGRRNVSKALYLYCFGFFDLRYFPFLVLSCLRIGVKNFP